MNTVTRLQPETALEAAGYVRVSRRVQAEGHSPEIQREAIKRLAAQEGYALTMVEEDHERGSSVTREGYQRIIEAVRAGTVHAVLVFMLDRWGRDGAEWLTRAREFDRLGVPIISVQEGRSEAGLMRFIRAGMAEEYSRQLGQRIRPARERSAREGTHCGRTPHLGYKRVYAAHEGTHRQPAGELVVDEATAWIVRELFTRYAAGGWSLRTLARWLNEDPAVPAPQRGTVWSANTVQDMLRNPTYKGMVRYNRKRPGLYATSEKGAVFVAEGRHEAIVSAELWETVQRRMEGARRRQTFNTASPTTRLASGLLRCAGCGGTMVAVTATSTIPNAHDQYTCLSRGKGHALCTTAGYRDDVAHAALLAEVRRLRGAPWTADAAGRLAGSGPTQARQATQTARALEQERERLRRHVRRMSELEDDPTPEQIAAFREVSAELSARIRGLEAQLATLTERAALLPDLRALHQRLTAVELGAVVNDLWRAGDMVGLRDVVQSLVESARVVERQPAHRSTWVRLAVTWTPDVRLLLDAGLLRLDAPEPAPHRPTETERNRDRWRRRHGQNLRYRVPSGTGEPAP